MVRRHSSGEEKKEGYPQQRKHHVQEYKGMRRDERPHLAEVWYAWGGERLEGQSLRTKKSLTVRCVRAWSNNLWSLDIYRRHCEAHSKFKNKTALLSSLLSPKKSLGIGTKRNWRERPPKGSSLVSSVGNKDQQTIGI